MIVLDASALVELVLGTEKASLIARRLATHKYVHAPHLIDLEVASTLRRNCAAKKLSATRAQDALLDLQEFPLIRHPHHSLLERVWQLRHRFTSYDASYIALAEMLESPLATCDSKLKEAGKFVEVF